MRRIEFDDDENHDAMMAWIKVDAAPHRSNSTHPCDAVRQAIDDSACLYVRVYEADDIAAALELEGRPYRLPTVFKSLSLVGHFVMVSYDY